MIFWKNFRIVRRINSFQPLWKSAAGMLDLKVEKFYIP